MLNFAKSDTPTYERHIYLYDKGDYVTFSPELAETKWDALKNDDIDAYAINITGRIRILQINIFQIKLLRYEALIPLGLQIV